MANSKYIQTPYGIMSLKYFFSESLSTSSGEEVSTREIKSILKECIDAFEKDLILVTIPSLITVIEGLIAERGATNSATFRPHHADTL